MGRSRINPAADGGCNYGDCALYDGKRCRVTGSRPYGCEPGWERLLESLRANVMARRNQPGGCCDWSCPLCSPLTEVTT